MKRIVTLLAIAAAVLFVVAVSMPAHAWGPGDSGGGEPPGPNATFAEGSQPQCLTPGDFWDQFLPELACWYVPPVKPPIYVPPTVPLPHIPAVPEPGALWLALAGLALVAWRVRK